MSNKRPNPDDMVCEICGAPTESIIWNKAQEYRSSVLKTLEDGAQVIETTRQNHFTCGKHTDELIAKLAKADGW